MDVQAASGRSPLQMQFEHKYKQMETNKTSMQLKFSYMLMMQLL